MRFSAPRPAGARREGALPILRAWLLQARSGGLPVLAREGQADLQKLLVGLLPSGSELQLLARQEHRGHAGLVTEDACELPIARELDRPPLITPEHVPLTALHLS